ncbi:MAG TPA: GUN4 domain-containing protein [Leptolyngbyaceae cyanobacterium M65_K2018_010]|nr:GUN4 domain-containing protein [Leptolyngbyaceae cyanobacterium M65_K2018_010]
MAPTPAWTLNDLAHLLEGEEWQAADKVTLGLLRAAVKLNGGSLTALDLAQMPCSTLFAIDALWTQASYGHFGFSVQQRLYEDLDRGFDPASLSPWNPHPFCQAVGWLMLTVPRPLAFFKFYDFLDFSLDAPQGHLPALWYWQLTWWESLQTGGLGTGRGGGFADLARLDALMLRLARCSQE